MTLATLLFSCEKETLDCPGATERTFDLSGFARVSAGETFRVTITKGNTYSIKATGCGEDLADLQLSIGAGDVLDIRYNKYKSKRYRVDLTITLPVLATVVGSGASDFTINGFAGQNSVIRAVLSGTSVCKLNGTGINTAFDLAGSSSLTVTGQTESLYGSLASDSRLYTYGLSSTEVDIVTAGTSKAWVFPQVDFYAMASGDSRIYYKGDPVGKHIIISGTSKVIKE